MKCNGSSSSQGLCENGGAITINGNEMANASDVGKGNANGTQTLLGKHNILIYWNFWDYPSRASQNMIY